MIRVGIHGLLARWMMMETTSRCGSYLKEFPFREMYM